MAQSQSTRPSGFELRTQGVQRGKPVFFTFDGRTVTGFAGESVAAALLAAGIRTLRASPRSGDPRGGFCWMGLCQECTVVADGVRRPACRLPVAEGLSVRSGDLA